MQHLRSTANSSRRPITRRELSRPWLLLLLLPMLLMSVWSATPHSHTERHLAHALQLDASSTNDFAHHVAISNYDSAASTAPRLIASTPETKHQDACLLCEWASIAGACLVVALALSLGAWLWRSISRSPVSLLVSVSASLSLRARAPPV